MEIKSIVDIENMSAADLKANRGEIVTQAAAFPPEELALRYIQASIDAKSRDVALAEHARTSANLNDALATQKGIVAERDATVTALGEQLKDMATQLEEEMGKAANRARTLAEENADLKAKLDGQTGRAERLKAQAECNVPAMSAAAKLLNDALSAQLVEAADKG